MALDEALLGAHRRFEDPALGYSEEFLQPTLGGRKTVAVLSLPLQGRQPLGWVICHSFGIEQVHLGRLDTMVARALAGAGFPVVRFHGRGYGDSEGSVEEISLSSHLEDAAEAVDLMSSRPDVEAVGVLGARFGGMVAALVAEEKGLSHMGLWQPTVTGASFLRELLRSRLLSEVVAGPREGASDTQQLRRELAANGWVDIQGFPLTQKAYGDISVVDLTHALQSFRGSSLLVGVSRTGNPVPGILKLSEHLGQLGGECVVETVQDAMAAQFGQFRFQTVEGGRGKRDVQLQLNEAIAAVATRWAVRKHEVSTSGMEL
jgi:pimeloyl-ACP methyl ester carboxylesterase